MKPFQVIDRPKRLKEFIDRLHGGETVEQVKEDFQREFGSVSAGEIAQAERQLVEAGVPIEEVQRLCDVHQTLFEESVEEVAFSSGHPAFVFQKENEGIEKHLKKVESLLDNLSEEKEESYQSLLSAWEELQKIDKHYVRKENLMFPYLEAKGITAPPKVMWGVDDEIRAGLKDVIEQVKKKTSGETIKPLSHALIEKIRSMIGKENNILMPMLMENMTDEDWKVVARESRQIGYVFADAIEGASPSDATVWETGETNLELEGDIVLPSGQFTVQELTHMLNALPSDITFVGADDRVRYFSEGKHRVFPRTRTIIGRDVANCHPPKSLSAVEELVEDFKAGRKDEESFWIQKDGAFIIIRYFAVRDGDEYLGVLEVSEEISELRSLEGEKRLISK